MLKTPFVEEEALQTYLSRLSITLELYATGIGPTSKPNEARPVPVKELLSEVGVDSGNEPVVVASKGRTSEDGPGEPILFVVWKVEIPLSTGRISQNFYAD